MSPAAVRFCRRWTTPRARSVSSSSHPSAQNVLFVFFGMKATDLRSSHANSKAEQTRLNRFWRRRATELRKAEDAEKPLKACQQEMRRTIGVQLAFATGGDPVGSAENAVKTLQDRARLGLQQFSSPAIALLQRRSERDKSKRGAEAIHAQLRHLENTSRVIVSALSRIAERQGVNITAELASAAAQSPAPESIRANGGDPSAPFALAS